MMLVAAALVAPGSGGASPPPQLGPIVEVTAREPTTGGQGPADQQPTLVLLRPMAAAGPPPAAMLVWQSGRGDPNGSALWYSTISFAADPQRDRYTLPRPLSGLDDGALESNPTCVLADLGPLCAWTSWPAHNPSPGAGAGPVVRLARYDRSLSAWAPSTSLPLDADSATPWQEQPALAVDPQGGVAIAYVSQDPSVVGDPSGAILLSRTLDGIHFLPAVEVSPHDNDAAEDSPTVAFHGDRIFVVFRTHDEELGAGEDWDLALGVRWREDLSPDPQAPTTVPLTGSDHGLAPGAADPDEQEPRMVSSPPGIGPQTGPYLLWVQGDRLYPGHRQLLAMPLDLDGGADAPQELSLPRSRDTADQPSGGWAIGRWASGQGLQVLGSAPMVAYRTGEKELTGLGDFDIILVADGEQINIVGDDSSGDPPERHAPMDLGPALLPLPPARSARGGIHVATDSGGALVCWASELTDGGHVDLDIRCRRWGVGVMPIGDTSIAPSALLGPLVLAMLWAISTKVRTTGDAPTYDTTQGRGRQVRRTLGR